MATNFHLGPPAKTVDGLLAVLIDISVIDAVFSFDAAAQTARADATITYEVGSTSTSCHSKHPTKPVSR